MANIKGVAAKAGLSVACVSKYLKNPESVLPSSRERIEAAIAELNYVPSVAAQSLRTKRSYTVKAITESIRNPFFAEAFEYIRLALSRQGYTTVLQTTDAKPAEPADFVGVDGVIICLVDDGETADRVARLTGGKLPVVSICGVPPAGDLSYVLVDIEGGARAATRHLGQCGKKRLAYVGGSEDCYLSTLKRKGFAEAAGEMGIVLRPEDIFEGPSSFQGGTAAAEEMIRRGQFPDGIVCENDIIAAGCLRMLLDYGVRVPEEIAVTGFDNILIARILTPSLTSAALKMEEICGEACRLLVDRMDGKPAAFSQFGTELMIRSSTIGREQTA